MLILEVINHNNRFVWVLFIKEHKTRVVTFLARTYLTKTTNKVLKPNVRYVNIVETQYPKRQFSRYLWFENTAKFKNHRQPHKKVYVFPHKRIKYIYEVF